MSEEEQISPEEKLLKVIQEPEAAAQPETGDSGQETVDPASPSAMPGQAAEASSGEPAAPVAEEPTPKAEPAKEKPKLELKKTPEAAKSDDTSAVAGKAQEEATKGEVAEEPTPPDGTPPEEGKGDDSGIKLEGVKLGEGVEVPDAGAGKIGADNVIVEDKKKPVGKVGVRTVNKYLMVAAIIVLCFVGWEAVSYQISEPEPIDLVLIDDALPSDDNSAQDIGGFGEGLVDIEKVLSAFLKNPIVAFPEIRRKTTTTTVVVNQGPQADWAKYTRANFKMKGRSRLPGEDGFMAVIKDNGSGKMHFLKAGDKVMIEKLIVTVKEVGAKYVKFTDGNVELTIE